jgi:hypothetical protein
MLLDLQRVDAQSPRRSRQGAYERCCPNPDPVVAPPRTHARARSFVMGPPHERVAVVLLDTRYVRASVRQPAHPQL